MKGSRRGITLVEMMVVLVLIGVVVSLTAVCLHGMLRGDRIARETLTRQTAIARLAQQFRSDAHAADKATLERTAEGAPQGLAFRSGDDRAIIYRRAGAKVERTVMAGDQRLHHDDFALAASDVEWSLADGFRPLASVVISVRPDRDSAAPSVVETRLDAAVSVP